MKYIRYIIDIPLLDEERESLYGEKNSDAEIIEIEKENFENYPETITEHDAAIISVEIIEKDV